MVSNHQINVEDWICFGKHGSKHELEYMTLILSLYLYHIWKSSPCFLFKCVTVSNPHSSRRLARSIPPSWAWPWLTTRTWSRPWGGWMVRWCFLCRHFPWRLEGFWWKLCLKYISHYDTIMEASQVWSLVRICHNMFNAFYVPPTKIQKRGQVFGSEWSELKRIASCSQLFALGQRRWCEGITFESFRSRQFQAYYIIRKGFPSYSWCVFEALHLCLLKQGIQRSPAKTNLYTQNTLIRHHILVWSWWSSLPTLMMSSFTNDIGFTCGYIWI